MSALDILLAVLGSAITLTAVVGMVMITPGGAEAHVQTPEADLAPAAAPRPAARRPETTAAPVAARSVDAADVAVDGNVTGAS